MQTVNLKKLRLLQGMTLEELADKLEISKQAVDSHEKGFSNGLGIRLSILQQHLTAMGVELKLTITLPDGQEMELKNPQK
jgi:transcriptional regulator with XRE-family HTH domain